MPTLIAKEKDTDAMLAALPFLGIGRRVWMCKGGVEAVLRGSSRIVLRELAKFENKDLFARHLGIEEPLLTSIVSKREMLALVSVRSDADKLHGQDVGPLEAARSANRQGHVP